jgi:hypothetical protein
MSYVNTASRGWGGWELKSVSGPLIAHKRRHRYAAARGWQGRRRREGRQHFSAMRKNFSSKVGKGTFPSSTEFAPPPSTFLYRRLFPRLSKEKLAKAREASRRVASFHCELGRATSRKTVSRPTACVLAGNRRRLRAPRRVFTLT